MPKLHAHNPRLRNLHPMLYLLFWAICLIVGAVGFGAGLALDLPPVTGISAVLGTLSVLMVPRAIASL